MKWLFFAQHGSKAFENYAKIADVRPGGTDIRLCARRLMEKTQAGIARIKPPLNEKTAGVRSEGRRCTARGAEMYGRGGTDVRPRGSDLTLGGACVRIVGCAKM